MFQIITEGMTYKPLHFLSTDIQRKSHLSQGVPKLSMEQHYKLDSLIHRLLEVGDIMTVVNLQDMFEHVNQVSIGLNQMVKVIFLYYMGKF